MEAELREACSLYNAALEERIGAWKTCRKTLTYHTQAAQIKPMRAAGCLTLKNHSCCQDVLRRVEVNIAGFFRRVKAGQKPGFPRFKSHKRYDSITFPRPHDGWTLLSSRKLRIQGIGHVKLKLHRPVDGTIRTVNIKRSGAKWFVVFVVERDKHILPQNVASIGIDVGLTSFAVMSNGKVVDNPHHSRKAAAHLRRCQRRVFRRKKGSNRRGKAVRILREAYRHVTNQRSDFHHKLSRWIVNSFGLIAVEALNIKALAAGLLSKSVNEAGWSQFFRYTRYKAADAGREFIEVDPRGTSQTCLCGAATPRTLRDRWHNCLQCGLSGPRDLISAQVILQRAGSQPSGANVGVVMPSVA